MPHTFTSANISRTFDAFTILMSNGLRETFFLCTVEEVSGADPKSCLPFANACRVPSDNKSFYVFIVAVHCGGNQFGK